jgi:hypothetical protein
MTSPVSGISSTDLLTDQYPNWDEFQTQLKALLAEVAATKDPFQKVNIMTGQVMSLVQNYYAGKMDDCSSIFSVVQKIMDASNSAHNDFNQGGSANTEVTPAQAQDIIDQFANIESLMTQTNRDGTPIFSVTTQLQITAAINEFYDSLGTSPTSPNPDTALAAAINNLWAQQSGAGDGKPPSPSWQQTMKTVTGDFSTLTSTMSGTSSSTQANYQFLSQQMNTWQGAQNNALHAEQKQNGYFLDAMRGTSSS